MLPARTDVALREREKKRFQNYAGQYPILSIHWSQQPGPMLWQRQGRVVSHDESRRGFIRRILARRCARLRELRGALQMTRDYRGKANVLPARYRIIVNLSKPAN